MKDQLPAGHGLAELIQEKLVFKGADGKVSITDVQHDSLAAGVACGKSLLVVSPTSTGKTQIAVWAIARALEASLSAVYLVTHRALAKQKFDDFQHLLLKDHLGGSKASVVLATGDAVEDAEGNIPADPLQAPLLVATYEKYLALLSASGVPTSFSKTVICCDEIQLVGDENRGRNVEILLTLLKNGGWCQFVGLSAVLAKKDATDLADWLGVDFLLMNRRDPYKRLLADPTWQADIRPMNGAHLISQWIDGSEIRALENSLPDLSAGMLREMFRNVVWVLSGFSNIVAAATDPEASKLPRPKILEANAEAIPLLMRLPRIIRRLSYRISEGLPDEQLWMTQIWDEEGRFRITRSEIVHLGHAGMSLPEKVMMGDAASDKIRVGAFKGAQPSPEAKANWFRDKVRDWKKDQRKRACDRQAIRAKKCASAELVPRFYTALGTEFESVFELVLQTLKIEFERLDDKTKTGAPDYLIKFSESKKLIVELKSKEKGNLVDYNKAVEVLAASEVHGHKDKFCVTLCHPGVDPSVPTVIAQCARLCVVESPDFGEAFLRLCEGTISRDQVWQWLTTPGQALIQDLPFRGQ